MDPHRARAQILLEQGRYDLAEPELRQALAAEPDDPEAHALLAVCLAETQRPDEATREAREAIARAPDYPFAHYVHGLVLLQRDRPDEAAAAAEEALRLNPEAAHHHWLKGRALLERRRWSEALAAADAGLAIDAADVRCANLRAAALIKLGRKDEAVSAVEGALERDPEDADTHAMHGWALLHRHEPKKAMEHFREALRLDPTSGSARAGLVEALKARNFVYALLLRWFLFMSRLGRGAQWALVIGGLVGQRALNAWADSDPRVAPYVFPIILAYIGFAVLTWIAYPLFNLTLLLHPLGRHALSDDQRKGALLTGAFLLGALACLGAGLLLDRADALLGAIMLGLMLPAVTSIHACSPGWPRRAMWAYAAGLLALGLVAIGRIVGDQPPGSLVGLFMLGAFASQFVANGLSTVRPRR